jgi:hypothetical protein
MADAPVAPVYLWVNPPETALPITASPLRVAIGTPDGRSTNSWKVWVHGDDTYVACRDSFRELKASLHASGTWRFGFTEKFAASRPEVLDGRDRAWKKWQPDLSDPSKPVIGFQVVATPSSLYLEPQHRASWPDSIVFVEPSPDQSRMTVVSVTVVQGHSPLRFSADFKGALVAILPRGAERTVQLVATHEPTEHTERLIDDAFSRTVGNSPDAQALGDNGIFFVHGNRGPDVPWVSAVPFSSRLGRV